jgi:hypothetical protein
MTHAPSSPRILVFYPSPSLRGQLQNWSDERSGRRLQLSFERSLAGIRRQIQGADFVLVDATEDSARASDAFLQIHKILGPDSMTVYTDVVHEGLEVLVRRLGVTLLLGPMTNSEWDDLFAHKFPQTIPLSLPNDSADTPLPDEKPSEEKTAKKSYPVKSIAG